MKRKKRALNGQPIELNAEVLVVAELTVYESMQYFLGTTNMDQTFASMRLYYAHLMNGVIHLDFDFKKLIKTINKF